MIEIYTDGACSGNPGPGGYGLVVVESDLVTYASDTCDNTTNNREELKAMLAGLRAAATLYQDEKCIIYSDSAYCVNMFNDWVKNWAKNGWKNSKKQTVENIDLVQSIYPYASMEWPNFSVEKIKGHSGNTYNELADALASGNGTKFSKIFSEGNIKGHRVDFLKNF